MRIGREELIPDRVGIGGRKESLGNNGESAGVSRSCTRENGRNASFRQFLKLCHSFAFLSAEEENKNEKSEREKEYELKAQVHVQVNSTIIESVL